MHVFQCNQSTILFLSDVPTITIHLTLTFALVQSAVISVGLSNLYPQEGFKNNRFKCTKKADDMNDGFSEKEEN